MVDNHRTLPPDSLREQETAGATEPEHYYELDQYPVPTSPQYGTGNQQSMTDLEYDYIPPEEALPTSDCNVSACTCSNSAALLY